ncbi:alpha/beta fold hydrolase [Demequina sediminicola]|uniref:alpha/beta fold hydrolase n=1 Tax=Demequina sediminicola TaxID=1095026 RepID=UPI000786801C|nr:alpha/beta hydrolase [Demequina sediminicola]
MRTRLDEARYREAERALWAACGLEPHERWVTVPGLSIRVRAMEVGSGSAVMFLHGTPTAGGAFAPLVAALNGVRSIVVDRPGCALSEPLDTSALTPTGASEAIAATMGAIADDLGDGPVHVVGNSAGGMAAIAFTAHRPDAVRSLTLEGVPAVQGMTLPLTMRAATLKPVAAVVSRWPVSERDFVRSMRQMGHGDLLDRGGLTHEQLAWRVALARHTDTYRHDLAALSLGAGLKGLKPGWAPSLETVAALKPPSLWVVGDRDPFATADAVRTWAARAPGSRFVERPGEGHQPWIDDPIAHASLLQEFWGVDEHGAS